MSSNLWCIAERVYINRLLIDCCVCYGCTACSHFAWGATNERGALAVPTLKTDSSWCEDR